MNKPQFLTPLQFVGVHCCPFCMGIKRTNGFDCRECDATGDVPCDTRDCSEAMQYQDETGNRYCFNCAFPKRAA